MEDYSYEILDLMTKYGGDLEAALRGENSPKCLYAFSPLRENLFEWADITKEDRVLQVGSDYGSYTGILAKKAKEVIVVDTRDENLEVNARRHAAQGNIRYMRGDMVAVCRAGLMLRNATTGEATMDQFMAALEALDSASTVWREYQAGKGITEVTMNPVEQQFDCVVIAGLLGSCTKEEARVVLEFAGSLLRPGGKLFAAAENETGLRYRMGAKLVETGFLETEFRGIFEEITRKFGGSFTMYYPVPDYRYPAAVYSDDHLPRVGDVSNISARLDAPGLWYGSEEEAMAKACQNGEFTKITNSFLGVYQVGEDGFIEDAEEEAKN